jgi:hypothetical protein
LKRPPKAGELALRHSTEQTGDVQTFAVCRENYNPEVIARMTGMVSAPLMGYRLDVRASEPGVILFLVCRDDGTPLTLNLATHHGQEIRLHSTILYPMPEAEAYMSADLEQCAALSLLNVEIL